MSGEHDASDTARPQAFTGEGKGIKSIPLHLQGALARGETRPGRLVLENGLTWVQSLRLTCMT
jgi:hypothetical protein